MATEYIEDVGLNDAVKDLLTDEKLSEFENLRLTGLKIMPLLLVKTNTDGDHEPCKGLPAKIRKVPDLYKAAGVDAHLILIVDYYAWNHPGGVNPENTKLAILHSALKTVSAEKKDGKLKIGKNEPDVIAFTDTIKRYGPTCEREAVFIEIGYAAASHTKTSLATGELDEPATVVQDGADEAPETSRRKKR
jgi:hypothetical protein